MGGEKGEDTLKNHPEMFRLRKSEVWGKPRQAAVGERKGGGEGDGP